MKRLLICIISSFLFCIILECNKETEMQILEINVRSINYFYKEQLLCKFSDQNVISEIVNLCKNAVEDKSKDNFKSFYFAKLESFDGSVIRIECFGNRIRYKGKRYSLEINIKELLDKHCGK